MKLYDGDFINIPAIMETDAVYSLVIGGRGIGKTYGMLKYCIETGKKIAYVRRTQTQLDLCASPALSPYKKIAADLDLDITCETLAKNTYGYFLDDGENKKLIAYGCAVSTFANARGFDGSDIDACFYDEFVPEPQEKPIKNEASALFNMIETISRNREILGQPPVKWLMASNSNSIVNPIFIGLNIVRKYEKLIKSGKEYVFDRDRCAAYYYPRRAPITDKKAATSLYKFTQGTAFYEMSLGNDFIYDDIEIAKPRKLIEYSPVVEVGELTIYQHKSNGRFYVSSHLSGTCPWYNSSGVDAERFRRDFSFITFEILDNNVDFEDYLCFALLTKYLKK